VTYAGTVITSGYSFYAWYHNRIYEDNQLPSLPELAINTVKKYLVGTTVASRQHVTREKFATITTYNTNIIDSFKFILPNRIIHMTQANNYVLTTKDANDIYDYLLTFCECGKGIPKTPYTSIPIMDEDRILECFTNCHINAVSSLFLR
jgi:hypothetical protein